MINLSDKTKTEIISAANTFVAAFISIVAATLSSHIEWTTAFWVSLCLAAVRSGIKAVVSQFVPVTLGGVKR